MKKIVFLLYSAALMLNASAQVKTKPLPVQANATSMVPAPIQGTWMYGNFSTAEYWSKNPSTYLGKAFSAAFAFVFKADGTYEQYFTSQATDIGGATYHQSLTKGTYTVDEGTKTITTQAVSSHYKRTRNGAVQEDRDLRPNEISKANMYAYATDTESNGTPSLSLTIKGTQSTLKFLKKNF